MSWGWSLWVMGLVTLNMGITFLLFLWAPRAKIPTQPDQTSGHVWAHGVLREGVRRLPGWWVWFSASMFVLAWIYLMLYPGYGHHPGALGWTSHGELARDVARNERLLGDLQKRFRHYTPEQLANDPAALQLGGRLFVDNCAACHGRGGYGNVKLGAPSLGDDDWRQRPGHPGQHPRWPQRHDAAMGQPWRGQRQEPGAIRAEPFQLTARCGKGRSRRPTVQHLRGVSWRWRQRQSGARCAQPH